MQNNIKRSSHPSVAEFDAVWRHSTVIIRLIFLRVFAGKRDDALGTQRSYFTAFTDAVAIEITPKCQVTEFGTGEFSVIVVIQRG